MKKRIASLLFFALLLSACKKAAEETSTPQPIKFQIEGEATGIEGVTLALHIPSQGLDNRQKCVVENGKFYFEGEVDDYEEARIQFEENILAESRGYSAASITLENGKIKMSFDVKGDSLKRKYRNITFKEGSNNIHSKELSRQYGDDFSYMVSSLPHKKDSLVANVYPEVREKIIESYNKHYTNHEYDYVNLCMLEYLASDFSYGPFTTELMTQDHKDFFINALKNIDPAYHNTLAYKTASRNIATLENTLEYPKFRDNVLQNQSNQPTKISDIVKSNKLTVLSFWFTGCPPCRSFNKSVNENYDQLRENGVEVVSINVDESKKMWLRTSKEDEITWPNLHADKKSLIVEDYQVSGYPTKILVTQDLEVIDKKIRKAEELIEIVKTLD